MTVWPVLALALLVSQQPETMSLLQKPLFAPSLPGEERARREETLAAARAAFDHDRASVDGTLGLVRALMALGRVGDALEVLTRALETKPDDPRLTLERARGLIVIRKFEVAEKELRKPTQTLADAPCALGVAEYLSADYARARESFGKCPDPGIFAYLADRRAGHSGVPRPAVSREPTPDPAAPIRLPGAVTRPGPATRIPMAALYMDAAERLLDGKREAAMDLLKQIVEKNGRQWMDPVYIAAEADYARLLKAEGKKGKKGKKGKNGR